MASITNQTSTQSGKDVALGTKASSGSETGKTIAAAATDTTTGSTQQQQTDDYSFTLAFTLKIRDAIPCAEV